MSDEQRPNLDWYEDQIKKCKEVIRKQGIEIHDAKTELAQLKQHHQLEQLSGDMSDASHIMEGIVFHREYQIGKGGYNIILDEKDFEMLLSRASPIQKRADLASKTQVDDIRELIQALIDEIYDYGVDDNGNSDILMRIVIELTRIRHIVSRTPKPTTDEERVMNLMADALRYARERAKVDDVYDIFDEPLKEYEKLKGGK